VVWRRIRRVVQRRERVVPVVTPCRLRAWRRAALDDWAAALHLRYVRERDRVQPAYFARSGGYRMPRRGIARAWRWYVGDVAVQSVRLLRRHGPAVRRATGVGLGRQLRELLWLSVTVPAMPEKYYTFEWYRPEYRALAGRYLHRHETKGALYALLTPPQAETVAPLNDKVAFARHAARAGLPVTPTLAVIGPDGSMETHGEFPAADLFVKPATGKGGRQARKWRYADGRYHPLGGPTGDGAGVPARNLPARLAAGAAGTVLLVQPCLTNHPDLADLALDAVPTCRVVTIIDESGTPEPVIAIFRMPAVPGSVVDNMHRGGIAAPVDITSGVLGPASGYATAGPPTRHTRHPVSGALIAGRKLPAWDAVRQLAVAAHRAFPPRVLVGWDIAIGPDGPVLVEGNEQPGVDGLQRLHDLPLGDHRFGQLLAFHLSRPAPADRRRVRHAVRGK
jgi:hypothetical protein